MDHLTQIGPVDPGDSRGPSLWPRQAQPPCGAAVEVPSPTTQQSLVGIMVSPDVVKVVSSNLDLSNGLAGLGKKKAGGEM